MSNADDLPARVATLESTTAQHSRHLQQLRSDISEIRSYLGNTATKADVAAMGTRNETANFAYLSAMTAGDPTGVPTGATGYCAVTYNDTDQKLWIYSTVAAKWVGVQLA